MVLHCMPQLNTDKPSCHPHIKMKGCNVGRDGDLQSWRNSQRGNLMCLHTSLSHRHQRFRNSTFRLLRGWLSYGSSGSPSMPPARGHCWGCVRKDIPKQTIQALCIGPHQNQLHLLKTCDFQMASLFTKADIVTINVDPEKEG